MKGMYGYNIILFLILTYVLLLRVFSYAVGVGYMNWQ